jgi:hypothetical protein
VADRDSGSKLSAGGHTGNIWGWPWQWIVVLRLLFAGVFLVPYDSTTWLNRLTWSSLSLGVAFLGLQEGWRRAPGQTATLVLSTLCFSASMILGGCSLVAGDGGGGAGLLTGLMLLLATWKKWQMWRVKAQPPSEIPGSMKATPNGLTQAEQSAPAGRPPENDSPADAK